MKERTLHRDDKLSTGGESAHSFFIMTMSIHLNMSSSHLSKYADMMRFRLNNAHL